MLSRSCGSGDVFDVLPWVSSDVVVPTPAWLLPGPSKVVHVTVPLSFVQLSGRGAALEPSGTTANAIASNGRNFDMTNGPFVWAPPDGGASLSSAALVPSGPIATIRRMGDRYLYDGAAESMQEEAEAWNRVQRQLVVLNWILTAATGVGAAAVVFLAVN